jgi:hypothetical protein
VTATNERDVGAMAAALPVQRDRDYGSRPGATTYWRRDCLFTVAIVGRNIRIHVIFSLIRGLLCAVIILGFSGCGGSDSAGNNADAAAAEEIPGVDPPAGEPPPDEVPGVEPDGEPPAASLPPEEIPGLPGVPGPPPPPCANAVGPFNSALCEAIDMELEAIEAGSPSDASERFEFLASLSSSPADAATQLADYEWLSTPAEAVFGEATVLLDVE